jgi:AbrB family looped-hinge helix DNA binding protein
VTIPVELRQKFGLLPHTEVEVVEEDGSVVIRPKLSATEHGSTREQRRR